MLCEMGRTMNRLLTKIAQLEAVICDQGMGHPSFSMLIATYKELDALIAAKVLKQPPSIQSTE